MAIAVSQAYKDVQSRRGGKRMRVVVQYKRRYFDPVAVAFAYEPNWHVMKMSDFTDPGEIVDQLDVAQPGIFKATTVTLRLKNTQNQWQRSVNDPSVFAADALAPNGYYDDQTLFQILQGYQKPDLSWEDCPQFTGYAADFTPLPKMGYVEVQVSASLLAEKCAAIKVNTAVAGEAMALSVVDSPLSPSPGDGTTALLKTSETGVISVANVKAAGVALVLTTDYTVSIPTDGTAAKITLVTPATWNGKALTWSGVNKALLTTSSAVTLVSAVYANGTAMTQGVDYTVSIPSGSVGPAQINLLEPELWIGKTFTWDGSKGALSKTVQAAVAMYCDASGIGSGSRNIQPVIFPGGLSSSKTIDSQADWQAGSLLQNVSTTEIPGSLLQRWFLVDDFSGTLAKWTFVTNYTIAIISGQLRIENGDELYTPCAGAVGTWEAKISASGTNPMYFDFIRNSSSYTGGTYSILLSNGFLAILKDHNVNTPLAYKAFSYSTQQTYRITRDASGVMNLYVNGVLQLTATDNTYTTNARIQILSDVLSSQTCLIDDIYYAVDVDSSTSLPYPSAIAEYQFNLLSTPASLGTLDHFEVLNGGGVVYKTACAPDAGGTPGTYDALQTLGVGNQMQSTPRQWLKIRVEITPAAGAIVSPEVQKLIAHFLSANVTLSQVAPTRGTAWDEIQSYAEMCNYETGWDASGIFFFRSRTVSGAPVISLDPWTNIIDVDDTHPGWDRVFNIGHARQTPYEYYYSKIQSGEAEPTSERRFGAIPRDLDFSGQLVANDALIGLAAAQTAYLDNFRPRWRCRAQVKAMPWLELSDPVSLTFVPDRKLLESIAGDTLQQSGFAGPQGVALAINKKMKIVGITKKLKACTADLLLEEILS